MSLIWGVPYLFIKVAVDDGVSPVVPVLRADRDGRRRAARRSAWRAGVLGSLRGRWRWIARLRDGRDHAAVPADRGRRAARVLVAGGDPDRLASRCSSPCSRSASTPPSGRRGIRLVGLLVGLAGVVALVGIDVAGKADELLGTGADPARRRAATRSGRWSSSASSPTSTPAPSMGATLLIAAVAAGDPGRVHGPDRGPDGRGAARRSSSSGSSAPRWRCVVFSVLIREVGPGRALVITYVNPVVAVALGVADPRRAPRRRRRRRPAA